VPPHTPVVPPGVPGGGIHPLVYSKQFNPQKILGKILCELSDLPIFLLINNIWMKSSLHLNYIYRGGIIYAYLIPG
jgi:hypothetical protein